MILVFVAMTFAYLGMVLVVLWKSILESKKNTIAQSEMDYLCFGKPHRLKSDEHC